MRILYLIPRKYYDTKMSRAARFQTWEAIFNHNEVDGAMSGPGFDSYPGIVEQEEFDICLAYKPLECPVLPNCPIVLNYNEMWDRAWTAKEILESGARIVVCHHENDIIHYLSMAELSHVWFEHIPHGVQEERFENIQPLSQRTSRALFTGVVSPEIYPVRSRLKGLIDSGKINGKVRRHPGYKMKSAAECNSQYGSYVSDLGNHMVSLCCTSKYRYALNKLHESLAAGCVVFSDMPDDLVFEGALGEFIQVVDPSESDARLSARINHVLNNPGEYEDLAFRGSRAVIDTFGHRQYAERFVRLCKEYCDEVCGTVKTEETA